MGRNTKTHSDLCQIGANYLFKKGIARFHRPVIVVCEFERLGECPDVFGLGYNTYLIEVKVSRPDFLKDKKKRWRSRPEIGLGNYRSYLCPEGLIRPDELPDKWGLLYAKENGEITVITYPDYQLSDPSADMSIALSIMRREGIYKKNLKYRK